MVREARRTLEIAARPGPRSREGFGQVCARYRAALYARVSASHQQTIPMQLGQMREYTARRGWLVTMTREEVQSAAKHRREREAVMTAARRREIDVVLVWRLDRWGRSLSDLVVTLKELQELGVAFVSLTEAFDLTTPTGRAMAGMVAVFAEFEREIRRDRVLAGIAHARSKGRHLGRPRSAARRAEEVCSLFREGLSKFEIARRLGIGRTSVRRILQDHSVTP
jgi:DNA invertase Pin-like site-specific DNA recombinase